MGSGALAIARLAAREQAPGLAALSLVAGALATWAGLDGADPLSPERPRIALSWGLAAAELTALLGAALLPALGLAGDLERGRAALLFARPLSRGALPLGRFLGASAAAALAIPAALAGALLVAAALLGPASLERLAPRDEFAAPFPRLDIEPGEGAGWTFETPAPLRAGGATLRVRPRYQIVDGIPANRGGRIRLRVTAFAGERALPPIELDLPTLGAAEAPLPDAAMSAPVTRLLLENATDGSILVLGSGGLALRGPPRSLLWGLLAAALGLALEAAFVAAVATMGAALLADMVAALLAFTLALVARAPEELRGLARRAAERAAEVAAAGGDPAAAPLAAAPADGPPALLRAAERLLDLTLAALPDLARADLAAPLLAGRTVDGRALWDAAAPLPWIAAALVLAALLLARREPGLGRAEVA